MKKPQHSSFLFCGLAAALAVMLGASGAKATPYASSITNNGSGTMSFYLNESGGNVTITYEDGSTNANYNGVATGTNLASGAYTFDLGSHTSYSISVYKLGAGTPTLINQSPAFTPRGIGVNQNSSSPYFGRVYASGSSAGGILAMNPDMSFVFGTNAATAVRAAGVTWANNGFSPYRLFVGPDDFLLVGDASHTGGSGLNDGVWRIDPNVTSNQLFLGPQGYTPGLNAGVHGTIGSKPIIIGNPQNGPVTLMDIDMDFPAANGYNSILVYTNISLTNLPYENAPAFEGPAVGLSGFSSTTLGGNSYPGLQIGPNGYVYGSTYRNNLALPNLQIYTFDPVSGTFVQIWNSYYNNNTADYFVNSTDGQGTVDIAVAPDGRYVVGVDIVNRFTICPLTNGIPNVANLFNNTPTSGSGNTRGVAFDAADNLYLSSSGIGLCQSWTLGVTTTATTTGNASGSTGFSVVFPATSISVVAATNFASQGGSDGNFQNAVPIPGLFTITRTNANGDYTSPETVNFSLTGTATNGVYTVSPAGITPAGAHNSVVLPPGVISTNITIIPTTNNVPRLQTTVILTVLGGPAYSVTQPNSDTVYIQNTSTNQLVVSAGAPTMYKAFSNDFASATITRLGDTNAPAYTIQASDFAYAGTAVSGVDFSPAQAVTFNPGDLAQAAKIAPLSNGVPPVDTIDPFYYGNRSVTLTLNPDSGYISAAGNSTLLTLIDNAEQPNPVLFTDPLTDPNDASHWNITYGTGDEANFPSNYKVEFGYDLTANNPESALNGLIGLPPNGATNALRVTCNQNFNPGAEGAVNVYYTSRAFSGNYAVRFNMNVIESSGLYPVAGPIFGINHNGTESNWWYENGPFPTTETFSSDGVWYFVQSPPGGSQGFGATDDYIEFVGNGLPPNTGWIQQALASAGTYTNVFKNVIFSAPGGFAGGTPCNNSTVGSNPQDNNWADVELKQVNKIVTLSIDKTPIFVYTNTSPFTNGYLMLGYSCPIGGTGGQYIANPEAAAYYSNLRVVGLSVPNITSITDSVTGNQNNVTIQFSSTDGDDTAASFALQSTTALKSTGTSGFADVASATITQIVTNNGAELFQATTSATNTALFYRIRHK